MRDLTHRERRAADAHIAGASYIDAYRVAYSTERMAPRTVSARAVEVFKRPPVAAYVAAANAKAATAAVLTKSEALEILSRHAQGEGPLSVRAIERLAKMLGWDEAEKHEVSGVTFTLDMAGRGKGGDA